MTADRLTRCGRALYGDRWQTDLARALDVNDRRVRQWLAGERPIQPGVWTDIAGLLRQRRGECDALLDELEDEQNVKSEAVPEPGRTGRA